MERRLWTRGCEFTDSKRSGQVEVPQYLSPVLLSVRVGLTIAPGDIVTERADWRQRRVLAVRHGFISLENLAEEDREAPAVDDHVMDAPHELMAECVKL